MTFSPDVMTMPHIQAHHVAAIALGMHWPQYCEMRRLQELQNAAYFTEKNDLVYASMCEQNAAQWQRRKAYPMDKKEAATA